MKKKEIIKIGDVEFKVLFGGLLPQISDEEYQRLKASIKEMGVLVPVLTDEDRGIIDGEQRLQATSELKLKTVPFTILHGLDDQAKKHLAIKLNAQRRHMTKDERLALATGLRKDGLSYRQIADLLNVHHETVRRQLGGVANATGESPDKVVGKDGKEYAAKVICKPKTRTNAKNVGEVKRAFDACVGLDPSDLPKSSMDVKRLERVAREKDNERLRKQEVNDYKAGQIELLQGDFNIKGQEIPDNSVDVIFTDPPYDKASLDLWGQLGCLANRVLKPSGLLVSYSGCLYLNQIFPMLDEHLTYLWTAAIYHSGAKKKIYPVGMNQAWKPILIYYKPPKNIYWPTITDMVTGGESKQHHDWEQSVDEALHYIKAFCPRNGVLLDPMAGSGTSLVAGILSGLSLRCIGIELDKAAHIKAEQRVKETIDKLESSRESA
ncbi:MAG: helix-turn-helix domain-containing protein [Planctomycetes bacterium]|nr:helix-turn-helix domain-containing protein [Planctomycetota bacterium]